MEVYVVFTYIDYRKELSIEILRVFKDYDKALDFVQLFTSEIELEAEYVGPKTTLFDHRMISPYYQDELEIKLDNKIITEEEYDLLNTEENKKRHEEKFEELGKYFPKGKHWGDRIAISKVPYSI